MKKILSVTFITILTFILTLNLVFADSDLSYSERRRLRQLPELTLESIMTGDFMEDFEKYALDQFAFRDRFRSLKAYSELFVFIKTMSMTCTSTTGT